MKLLQKTAQVLHQNWSSYFLPSFSYIVFDAETAEAALDYFQEVIEISLQ